MPRRIPGLSFMKSKFKKGDIILHYFYREVLAVGGTSYKLKPLFADDRRQFIIIDKVYGERHYRKVTKLELLLLGLEYEI